MITLGSKTAILIPARLESTRLPRKLLLEAEGKTVLQWTWEAAKRTTADYVAIVTDSDEIEAVAIRFGADVIRSESEHISGTSRIFEASHKLKPEFGFIINWQADEPTIRSGLNTWFVLLRSLLLDGQIVMAKSDIATLYQDIDPWEHDDRSVVKVAVSESVNMARYFSRSCLPGAFKHVGIYAFRRDWISNLEELEPSPLHLAENLEQLTWLECDFRIGAVKLDKPTIGIDTPEDFERFKLWAKEQKRLGHG